MNRYDEFTRTYRSLALTTLIVYYNWFTSASHKNRYKETTRPYYIFTYISYSSIKLYNIIIHNHITLELLDNWPCSWHVGYTCRATRPADRKTRILLPFPVEMNRTSARESRKTSRFMLDDIRSSAISLPFSRETRSPPRNPSVFSTTRLPAI
jgi:hypothetical protein